MKKVTFFMSRRHARYKSEEIAPQAPAKLGWVALFSANSTTHPHPPGKVYFAASIYPSILSSQALAML